VAEALGFARITQNSLDGVSDRDFSLELLSDLSILMMHLSRFSEEIVLCAPGNSAFSSWTTPFPRVLPSCRRRKIRTSPNWSGQDRRVYGDLMALLTVMKGLPLAYNKDMQEDMEPLFDAFDTALKCLPVFKAKMETLRLQPDKCAAPPAGLYQRTECADYLVSKGLPFRDAYTVVGKLVHGCIENGKTLEELSLGNSGNSPKPSDRTCLMPSAWKNAWRPGACPAAPLRNPS
jgi:argininosuccinate lyase